MQSKKVNSVRVAVFRPEEHLNETVKKFRMEGFEVIAAPLLKTVIDKGGIDKLRSIDFDTAIITSRTAAKIALENVRLEGKKVIAIGKKTAEVLNAAGIEAETPSKFDSKSIVEEFAKKLVGKVVILRSDKGDPVLLKLADYANVEEVTLYTIEEEHGKKQTEVLEKIVSGEVDVVVFSSRMMVHSFMELAKKSGMFDAVKKKLGEITVIAIGPPTARTLEGYGIKSVMPKEYTFDGVLELLKEMKDLNSL